MVQENGLVEKSGNKSKKASNGKAHSKSAEDRSPENCSQRGDDASSKVNDLGDKTVKDSDLVCDPKVSDNGSQGSITSDLIKDITVTAAKLDNNKRNKYKNNKLEVDDTSSSGGEGPMNGPSINIYSTSLVGDSYIFTDYDSVSLPVEEDFVMVSTKKKKVRSVVQSTNNQHFYYKDTPFNGGGSHYYNSYKEFSLSSISDNRPMGGVGTQLPSRGEDCHPPRPLCPISRSVTPPPTSLCNSLRMDGSNDSNCHSYSKTSRDPSFS